MIAYPLARHKRLARQTARRPRGAMRLEASFYGFVTRETNLRGVTDGPRPVSRVEPSAGDSDGPRRVRSSERVVGTGRPVTVRWDVGHHRRRFADPTGGSDPRIRLPDSRRSESVASDPL
ncbi:hypothetical protein AB7C87_04590 [Natrarchaeobius sp. A-rgal3]|uniref:hypothetical protein n=1 Tax=Natrarchaeobius versutus TaxID=1679078 RepID=UPI00350FE80F